MMKECNSCFETKPYEDFHKKKKSRDGYKNQCKVCTSLAESERYFSNADARRQKQRETQRRFTAKKMGLTESELSDLYDKQGNRCAICLITEEGHGKYFAIDHDHTTGDIRGLLCMSCNTGLGNFKDNPDYLRMAIKYLEGE